MAGKKATSASSHLTTEGACMIDASLITQVPPGVTQWRNRRSHNTWFHGDTAMCPAVHGVLSLIPAATKLGQGNVFTGVCDSVNRGVSASVHAGIHPPGSRHPLEQTPPSRHRPTWSRHPPSSRHPHQSRHPQGADTPLGADTPFPGADTPLP